MVSVVRKQLNGDDDVRLYLIIALCSSSTAVLLHRRITEARSSLCSLGSKLEDGWWPELEEQTLAAGLLDQEMHVEPKQLVHSIILKHL